VEARTFLPTARNGYVEWVPAGHHTNRFITGDGRVYYTVSGTHERNPNAAWYEKLDDQGTRWARID
jgi:hypothetical protein